MPFMPKLTETSIAKAPLPKPGQRRRLIRDGGCVSLYLSVKAGGARSWLQILQNSGKRREIGLGPWPLVSVEAARQRAWANRAARDAGTLPSAKAGPTTKGLTLGRAMPTFGQAVDAVHELLPATGRTAANFRSRMDGYAAPLTTLPVDQVTRQHVLAVLRPVWLEKEATARAVRLALHRVFDWAISSGHRLDNPADKAICAALPRQDNATEHRAALPWQDAPAAYATIGSDTPARAALAMILLTGARIGSVVGAQWSEIDLERAVWNIPAGNMKMARPHSVPLAPAAVELLASLPRKSDRVFGISKATVRRAFHSCGFGNATIHGFRATLSDWLLENTDATLEVRRAIRAHETEDATQKAYERTELLERRRPYMIQWAEYLGS